MSAPRNLAVLDRNQPQDVPRTLPYCYSCDLEPQLDGAWLIKGLLASTGIALVYGHSIAGKSFFAVHLGMCVALAKECFGRKTDSGLVVYVAAEGASGLRNRVAAYRRDHGITGREPFILISTPIDLHSPDGDLNALLETIQKVARECGAKPALIIIDTVSKTLGAGKENTDDLAVYVSNCQRVASIFECTVMPIHHRPKDSESTEPRGHGSLKAGVDTVILIEGGSTRRATVMKQKDGPDGVSLNFTLRTVVLGVDEDGDEVTSCVVEEADSGTVTLPIDPRARAITKLRDGPRLVLRMIGDGIAAVGIAVPDFIPDAVIDRRTVGKVCQLGQLSDDIIEALRTGSDTKPDSARKAFDRARIRLQSEDLLGVWGDYAWLK